MSHQSLYIDFLIRAEAKSVHGLSEKTKAESQHLLDRIVIADAHGKNLTVTQAMRLIDIASPSTLHRRLGFLQSEALIAMVYHEGNRRTKFLVPLLKTQQYLAHMGRLMLASVDAHPTTVQ